jgi:hypothetical protein
MDRTTLNADTAQAPQANIPRCRPFRIPRVEMDPTADKLRQERIAFNICVERAVSMIARERCSTRRACRAVGFPGGKAERAVRKLCDERHIPRGHWFGGAHPASPDRAKRKELSRRVDAWRAKNRDRARALSAVATAIKTFELERGPCAKCGSEKNIVAGPVTLVPRLRVEWRCRQCSNARRGT